MKGRWDSERKISRVDRMTKGREGKRRNGKGGRKEGGRCPRNVGGMRK